MLAAEFIGDDGDSRSSVVVSDARVTVFRMSGVRSMPGIL